MRFVAFLAVSFASCVLGHAALPVDIDWFLQSYDIGFDGFFIELLGLVSSFSSTFPHARLRKSFYRTSMEELPMRANSSVMWELLPEERSAVELLLSDRHVPTFSFLSFTSINSSVTQADCDISSEPSIDFEKYDFGNLSRPVVSASSPLACCEACIGTSHCTAWAFTSTTCLLKGPITAREESAAPITSPLELSGSLLRTVRRLHGRLPAPSVQVFHGTSCHAFNVSISDASVKRDANTIRIGRFMMERDISIGGMDPFEMHVMKCSIFMDEIWVPTEWNRRIFQQYYQSMNMPIPAIAVIPEAVDTSLFDRSRFSSDAMNTVAKPFEFLSMFKWEFRKGWDILLEAYWATFSVSDNVQLRLRTYRPSFLHGSRNITSYIEQFARERFRKELSDLPPVIWDGYDATSATHPGFLSREGIIRMLLTADAFVLPTRGEGWGLPIAEAMALEIPVIVTNCSGPETFANDSNAYMIQTDDGLDELGFVKPNVASLMTLMRAVMTDPAMAAAKARRARETMMHYSPELVTGMMRDRLEKLLQRRGWELRQNVELFLEVEEML